MNKASFLAITATRAYLSPFSAAAIMLCAAVEDQAVTLVGRDAKCKGWTKNAWDACEKKLTYEIRRRARVMFFKLPVKSNKFLRIMNLLANRWEVGNREWVRGGITAKATIPQSTQLLLILKKFFQRHDKPLHVREKHYITYF